MMSEHSLREQSKATVSMSKHPNRTEQSQNLAKLPLHPRKPTEVNGGVYNWTTQTASARSHAEQILRDHREEMD